MRLSPETSLIAILLFGCPRDGTDGSSHRSDGTGATLAALAWPYGEPVLEGDELVPGYPAELWIDALPAGSEVTFFQSAVGMGDGPCDPRAVDCSVLLAPIEYGSAVADAAGSARFGVQVARDAVPDVVYFQALVVDPATGSGTWSMPMQRHVSVPPSDSHVALEDHTSGAGIQVFTYGNSHTGGAAWLDYNGDLWPDLFVANGGGLNHRLFRNDGDGSFTDVSDLVRKPGVALEDAGAAFADIDNDGDVDLLVVVDSPFPMDSEIVQPREGGPNLLYVNNGDGTFTEDGLARGVVDPRGWRNITGVFADFDADGDVDLHFGTWAMNQEGNDRFGRLLLNDGTGRFRDSGQKLGYGRDVLTSLAADLDGDGWSELYLGNVNKITGFVGSNPLADDVLYRNDRGELVDVTAGSPGMGDDAWAAMGLDVGDIDNDGDFDLYEADRWVVDDPLPRGNPLYLNNGDGTFSDNVCDVAGVCTGYASWPTQFADFDRDGWVDLWVGTGKKWYVDLIYVNNRDGTFASHFVPSLDGNAVRGSAVADYDGDGAMDLFVWNLGADSRLYVNFPRDVNHWVEVKLIGRTANREGIGAVVRATRGGSAQLRQVSGGDGAHSQSSSIVHFGLGGDSSPVTLEISWPGGRRQTVSGVPVDRLVRIDELDGLLPDELVETSATWSAETGTLSVAAKSSYGGRSTLATPYGALTWDPDALRYAGSFDQVPQPASIEIANGWGQVFTVPVEVVP